MVDLGMVREVDVADGRVEVMLALNTMACPLREHRVTESKRQSLCYWGSLG